MEEMPWDGCILSGLIDDYFPDYQSDCGAVILLNGGLAQKSGVCRFFCWFFLFSRRVIMGVMFLIRRKPVHRGESAFSIS